MPENAAQCLILTLYQVIQVINALTLPKAYRRIEEKTGRFAPAGMEVAILSILLESARGTGNDGEVTITLTANVALPRSRPRGEGESEAVAVAVAGALLPAAVRRGRSRTRFGFLAVGAVSICNSSVVLLIKIFLKVLIYCT